MNAPYLQRQVENPELESKVIGESLEEILVPTEFLTLADMILYEVFKGPPDPKVWTWLNKRFPPLVVRTVRLALLEASTDIKKDKLAQATTLRVDQHYNYIGYQMFVKTVRAMALSKLIGTPIKLIIETDSTHAIGSKTLLTDQKSDELMQKFASGDRLPIQTFTLASMEDVNAALAMLRGGPGIIVINIKPLSVLGNEAVKKAIRQLKRTASITHGGVIAMGDDFIMVTNEIPIEKLKR